MQITLFNGEIDVKKNPSGYPFILRSFKTILPSTNIK